MQHEHAAQDMLAFINASPSPWHATEEAVRRLEAAGFTRLTEEEPWPLSADRGYYLTRGATVAAFRTGTLPPAEAGLRILGAHVDSPGLRLKPKPEFKREGYHQLGVEVYGGPLLASWVDRDLGLSGRLVVRGDGPQGLETRLVRIDEPIARISQLAIHLNRKVNDEGLKLNPQTEMPPMLGLDLADGALMELLARQVGVQADDILGSELQLHHAFPARVGGLGGEFVFAPRLDDQAMSWACLEALLAQTEPSAHTRMTLLYDHEEIGSSTYEGARGNVMALLLARLTSCLPGRGDHFSAAARSFFVSADMAHAIHPAFPGKHDQWHKPQLNQGVVLKTNAKGRYATNAVSHALVKRTALDRQVPIQEFVNRADLACGSTIGPAIASMFGIPTVDLGLPQLSMHSAREVMGSADPAHGFALLSAVLDG